MHQKSVKIFSQTLTLNLRNDGDEAVANEVFRDREYSRCDKVIVCAQHAILDIGGHVGFFALYGAVLNPKVPIYSFEPHEDNFKILKENLKQNRIKNVRAKNVAVSDQMGEVELRISKEDLNHSVVHAIEDVGERQKVYATTLERILEQNRLDQVDLVKMDCEGAEFQILFQAPKAVFGRIQNIFLEYHDWVPGGDHKALKRFLEGVGFRVEDYPNHKMKELGFLWCEKK